MSVDSVMWCYNSAIYRQQELTSFCDKCMISLLLEALFISFYVITFLLLQEMLGELFTPIETPEAQNRGFLKGFFGGNAHTFDREELCASFCLVFIHNEMFYPSMWCHKISTSCIFIYKKNTSWLKVLVANYKLKHKGYPGLLELMKWCSLK